MATPTAPVQNTHPSLQALLSTANTTISIRAEQLRPNANPHAPAFLHSNTYSPSTSSSDSEPPPWFTTILPLIATLTFRLDSIPNILFASSMLAASSLSSIYTALILLSFPHFY